MSTNPSADLPPEVLRHYGEQYDEAGRLLRGTGRLELARSQEILARYLPPPPAVVLDVGGGPGIYACWLASSGYEVHLIDAVPLHVEQARRASDAQPEHPLASATVGDARYLEWPDESADALLLFGPLYHLTERADRIAALREGRRVLRSGGCLFAAAISRFASVLDGLVMGFMDDPQFAEIVMQDLQSGQHRNPTGHPAYFTTSYFHHPDELRGEIEDAGLHHEATLPVEGIGDLLSNFDEHWQDEQKRSGLLEVIRRTENEPSIIGVSRHLIGIGRKA